MLMSKIVYFFSILTLTSTHHLTLTMNDLKNIFAVSILHPMDNKTYKIIEIGPSILEILFSPDFCQILLIINTNYMLIRC